MQFKNFYLRRVGLGLASLFVLQGAWALEPFAVKDIRVEGLQRVEAGTVFASLPVRVGDTAMKKPQRRFAPCLAWVCLKTFGSKPMRVY